MAVKIEENILLAPFTTFKIGGQAKFFARLKNKEDVVELVTFAKGKNLPTAVLGGGSNVIVSADDLNALVIKNEILGKEIIEEDGAHVLISVGAGESWDELVAFAVEHGFAGIEALSAIPGTVGGAPIQNIGAYGAEVSSVIDVVSVYDTLERAFKDFTKEECDFSYRESVFKRELGRFIIINVTFVLKKKSVASVPDYPGVKEAIQGEDASLRQIREAIIKIRGSKLPSPSIVPNVGSFFKNPIVSKSVFEKIKESWPNMKSFSAGENLVKIPAGWLIEAAGLKDLNFGQVSTYKNNAVVLVNNGAATFQDVLKAEEMIKLTVKDKFGIELEREPIIIS